MTSAIFITFSGNCKKALTFYQDCFGGHLQFETFENELLALGETPVINGSLISDSINIYGSDLVHDEGRKIGNHISIYLNCENQQNRNALIKKLTRNELFPESLGNQHLVEVRDAFDVRWMLGVYF